MPETYSACCSTALKWNLVIGTLSLWTKQMWEGELVGLTFKHSIKKIIDPTGHKGECGWPWMMSVCQTVCWVFESGIVIFT